MLYEIKMYVEVQDTKHPEKMKNEKHHFILDAELFGECEMQGLSLYEGENKDVFAIYRSPVREIINTAVEGDKAYRAKIMDVMEIDGKEKAMNYYLLVFARDLKDATNKTLEYIRQGYDMRLVEVKKSPIEAFLEPIPTRILNGENNDSVI